VTCSKLFDHIPESVPSMRSSSILFNVQRANLSLDMKLSVYPKLAKKFRISGSVLPLPHMLSCRAHRDNSYYMAKGLRNPPPQRGQPFIEMTTNLEPYLIRIPFGEDLVIWSSTRCLRIMRRGWDTLSITLYKNCRMDDCLSIYTKHSRKHEGMKCRLLVTELLGLYQVVL